MFWEIQEHVAATENGDGGFALWFEADMVPARTSWLDELHAEWVRHDRPFVMGRLQPRSYVPASRVLISPHINGGACYAKDYARHIPASLKRGTFDVAPWPFLRRSGKYVATSLFQYATLAGLEDELRGPAAVLHAYRQDKPAFYARWVELVTGTANEPTRKRNGGPCCDLRKRHLGVTYCPIHSSRTPPVKVANWLSLCAAVPYFSVRRRVRKLARAVGR
jgi:hypothetical protein